MEGFSTEEIPNLHDEAVVPDRKKNGKMHKRGRREAYAIEEIPNLPDEAVSVIKQREKNIFAGKVRKWIYSTIFSILCIVFAILFVVLLFLYIKLNGDYKDIKEEKKDMKFNYDSLIMQNTELEIINGLLLQENKNLKNTLESHINNLVPNSTDANNTNVNNIVLINLLMNDYNDIKSKLTALQSKYADLNLNLNYTEMQKEFYLPREKCQLIFEKEYTRYWRIERNEESLILAGSTLVNSESKASILELNNKGEKTWNKVYGDEIKYGISRIAVSSGICIGGGTPDEDFWVAKLDLNGQFMWNGTLGTRTREIFTGIAATTEGDCVPAGWTGYISDSVLVAKFASLDGELKWEKTHNFSPDDQTEGIITTLDQGFIVFGDHYVTYSIWNGRIIKLDKDGNIVWTRSYSFETGNYHEKIQGAVELGDRNLIFISIFRPTNYWDFRIFKTDPDGALIWNATIPQDKYKYNSRNIIEL